MDAINLDERVGLCPECLCEKRQCVCGSDRHPITMSRGAFIVFQAMEDHNVPCDTVDTVLIMEAINA